MSATYYQPADEITLLENGHCSSSVWYSKRYCMDDTTSDEEPEQFKDMDIEQPYFIDLDGFNVSKFVLESLTKCSDIYVDGTDEGKDYAFCVVDPLDADWVKAKSYLESELSGEDCEEALKELDEVEKAMRSAITIEDRHVVAYWNYN